MNIVRSAEQAKLLRDLGATHVVDSSSADFIAALTDAVAATGATIAFDAVAGGKLGSQILGCMEAAINRTAKTYSRYGSSTHKQLYIYGSLDNRPTELGRNFGLAWGIGGWLVTPAMMKLGAEGAAAVKQRVARELTTTFASLVLGGGVSVSAARSTSRSCAGTRSARPATST